MLTSAVTGHWKAGRRTRRPLFALIPYRESRAAVLRSLQFVDRCDGIVFHGNATVAASVYDQVILAETEFSSPLARLEEPRRGKIGPVRAACFEVMKNLVMSLRDR